jgi:hypothetical protein
MGRHLFLEFFWTEQESQDERDRARDLRAIPTAKRSLSRDPIQLRDQHGVEVIRPHAFDDGVSLEPGLLFGCTPQDLTHRAVDGVCCWASLRRRPAKCQHRRLIGRG